MFEITATSAAWSAFATFGRVPQTQATVCLPVVTHTLSLCGLVLDRSSCDSSLLTAVPFPVSRLFSRAPTPFVESGGTTGMTPTGSTKIGTELGGIGRNRTESNGIERNRIKSGRFIPAWGRF